MAKLESLHCFLSQRLTAVAVEILGAVEKVLAEYQEEISQFKEDNDRLRRQLPMTPEIKQCRTGTQPLSLKGFIKVVPEQQYCKEECYPSLRQEEPPTHIKEEPEEQKTSKEQHFQELEGNNELTLGSPCVKSEWDHESVSHSSAVIGDQIHSPPLDPGTPLEAHSSKLSTMSKTDHCSFDCGKVFALKSDLHRHVILTRERPIECPYNSTCELKTVLPLSLSGYPCHICGKTFKNNGHLSQHMRIHKRERPFSCKDCGKSFYTRGLLKVHAQTHKGEKPFSCGDCGISFYQKGNLTQHLRTHTGEKPFSCGECGNKFSRKTHLNRHILTHTGVKRHGCSVCGRRFAENADLRKHVNKVHKEQIFYQTE
ncbi:hypothetical protein UPYG_G00338750 [Umbra pygmaea]|uniref:C2H2-type domain-containing protein n=1 Tax=Umbra pygmaea TaxID=75934 RepID=A0ABD0VWC8_UMBPY